MLRPASSLWTFGIVAAFVLWLFVDAVLRGATEFALTALPWLLLVLWTVYVVMLRPCVALGPDGITIVNVFRRHRIAWALVDDFTTRFSLLVRLKDGRAIRSWGAPSTGIDRPFQTGSSDARFAAPEQPRAAGVRRTGAGGLGRPARRSEPTIGSIIEGARDRWDTEPAARESAITSGAGAGTGTGTGPGTGTGEGVGAGSPESSSAGRQRVSRWEWWSMAVTLVLVAACALTLA
ncbi:PH domain-containing protein [Planctomonas deserti]|uniref:PH domain-containing protein n=1 Tax=Planctomonas deserti TaxID=2144185 RepID=UPI000D398C9D|nr:PH domain-containing protein [Planctomonas deserti]